MPAGSTSAAAPDYVPGHGLLAGKAVLVTAAAGTGIGFATAKRCLEEGAAVVLSDAHERRLGEAAAELGVEGIPCDVTDEAAVQALVSGAAERLGRLDVVVNNAGLGGTAPLVDMTDEQWSIVLDVTLTGTFRMTRAVLRRHARPGLRRARQQRLGARLAGQAGQAHYAAAKAGVMALTRCAAVEAAEFGVRVNAVAPSLAMHRFLAKVTSDELLDELTGPRGVRAGGRAVGGGQRHRVPGLALQLVHDRRGRGRQLATSLRAGRLGTPPRLPARCLTTTSWMWPRSSAR